jgi:hypothetical protein
MALAPVDFYAYSRATGVPVPEDPEERASLAPSVAEFRRNQLRAPQQESQLPGILGAAALGLGIVGAGLAASRRFGRGIPQAAKPKTSGVSVTDLEKVARAQIPTYEPVPSKVVVPETAIPQSTVNLTEIQQFQTPAISQQQIQASDTGLDQVVSRVDRSIQRDTDFVKFSQTADVITERSNRLQAVADQVQSFEQELAALGPKAQELTVIPDIDQQVIQQVENLPYTPELARQQLQQRRESLAQQGYTPSRIERALLRGPEGTRLKQASELFAVTGDPETLRLASNEPALPLQINPVGTQFLVEGSTSEIPTQTFYEPFAKREPNIGKQIDTQIRQTNLISDVTGELKAIPTLIDNPEYQRISENTLIAKQLLDSGYESKTLRQDFNRNMALLQSGKVPQQIPNPEVTQLQRQLESSQNIRAAALEEEQKRRAVAAEFPNLYRMKRMDEGVRVFGEVNPETGEIIQETLQVRPGRQAVDLEPKTGGGRTFAMYDPETQAGTSIGIYGIEPRDFPIADPEMRPTALQREETKAILRSKPEGGPALDEYIEATQRARAATPEIKKSSLEVSEALRRARIEGRDPQMVLRRLGLGG